MKITRLSVFHKNLPLKDPYWLSGGRLRFDVLDATFVKVETDTGLVGWGEGTPWGHTYVPAYGPGIRAGLQIMAPVILGLDPRKTGLVERAMDTCLPGHLYAKSPVDMACWDIAGQAAGISIADMLGGRHPEGTWIASSVSSGAPDYMMGIVQTYRDLGYRVHSVKVGGDIEADITRIRHLEEQRLPDERILYDVNRAWTRREASIVMNAVGDLGITVEQPCESLDDIAALRSVTTAPISVDESLVTLQDAARIARDGIADVFNIKLNRVGGLTKACRIRDMALAHGIQMYIMATGGSVLADTEAAHLAQTIPAEFRLGGWSCQEMLTVDVAPGRGARNIDGQLSVTDAPGLDVAPDEDSLGAPIAVYEG
ncbi:MAG: mandelate racemase [Rhodobacteraceae bacterium]|nr:mandelate racemase [Paracoccaceae bacterium]